MKTETKTHESYRSFLREVLIEKQRKNPQLSLRSFAKTLGIQSSFLSMVLSGKRDLSEEMASSISEKLSFSEMHTRKFNLLLRLEKTQNTSQKEQLLKDLAQVDPSSEGRRDLAVDQFRAISEWYHLPLQILIDMNGFDWSEEAAAEYLGITIHEVRSALERLEALELIDLSNPKRPKRTEGRLMVSTSFQTEAMKKYNTQMLKKTIEAVDHFSPEERFTGTLNLALDEEQYQESRAVLKEAMEKLSQIASKKSKKKSLYHTNLNLFQLNQTKMLGDKK